MDNLTRISEKVGGYKNHIYLSAGIAVLGLFTITALFADSLSMHELQKIHTPFLEPSLTHLLGANDMGYDIFTELIHASRVSLIIGVSAAFVSIIIGSAIGALAGYLRGVAGELLTGLIDVFLLIPMLPLMIIISAYLGQSIWNTVLVISLLSWCSTARAVRAQVMKLREATFVEALKALGIPLPRIIIRHIIPNIMDVISAKFVVAVASAMLSEAALSFLGLGDPTKISWGTMIHYAFKRGGFSNGMWYWYLPPGLCIGACTMGFVLLGLYIEGRNRKSADGIFDF